MVTKDLMFDVHINEVALGVVSTLVIALLVKNLVEMIL